MRRLFLLLVAVPVAAQARPVPTVVLDHGAKEHTGDISVLFGLRELRDGRVIVLDVKEKELRVMDFATNASTPISRIGQGPLEYQVPGMLMDGAKDSILYYDMGQRRFLALSPTGKPVGTTPFGSTETTAMFSQMTPASGDALGHVFGQPMGMSMPASEPTSAADMPKFADSVSIVSLDRRTGKTTAIAKIRNVVAASEPKIEMVGSGVRMTMIAPSFRSSDVWAALPNGRVAILRNGEFRVHFFTPGAGETLGPAVAFTPVPVTAVEKKAVVDSVRKAMTAVQDNLKKMTAGAANSPTFDIQILEPKSWPAAKPPYIAMQSSPDGRLWVSPSAPAGTKAARFDVLDGTGALVLHVQLAAGETFAGVGRGTVYTIRTDGDGLQHLRRYVVP